MDAFRLRPRRGPSWPRGLGGDERTSLDASQDWHAAVVEPIEGKT
jgi:hypothetical protein